MDYVVLGSRIGNQLVDNWCVVACSWTSEPAVQLVPALLAGRIWWVDRKAAKFHGPGMSQLRPMLYIIIDAGVIYTLALLVTMTCFFCQSNFHYVLLPMVSHLSMFFA